MVGQFWTHAPNSKCEAFENLWFSTALRQRLHIHSTASGQRCQLRRAEKSGELCLQELSLEHVHSCQTGAGRMRPHRNALLALTDELRVMGAYADVER